MADAVDVDAGLPGPVPRHRHVNVSSGGGSKGMERRGRTVAQDGVRPAGQNRRHPPCSEREASVADRINAALKAVKPAGRQVFGDLVPRVPDEE
jgi:hypothetical protein